MHLKRAGAAVAVAGLLAGCTTSAASPLTHRPSVAPARPMPRRSRTPDPKTSTTTTTLPPAANGGSPARMIGRAANLPDPFVLVAGHGYYMYSSQTGFTTPPVSVSFSRDLVNWSSPTAAMKTLPPWAVFGFTWAPDVRRVAGRYVMYFDSWARRDLFYESWLSGFAARAQCIGTATSASPVGPFRAQAQPLVCMFDHHGAIDPRTFVAPDGGLWLDWKSDDNANFPTATAVTHLFAQRLSPNGLALVGGRRQLLEADRPWENRLIEAPDMVYAAGHYWLFFSGDWFNSPGYSIGLAECRGPAGPCVDWEKPFLTSNRQGQGPGEESLFRDDRGRWWMVYSPWFDGYRGRHYRPVALARMVFLPSKPYVAKGDL